MPCALRFCAKYGHREDLVTHGTGRLRRGGVSDRTDPIADEELIAATRAARELPGDAGRAS